MELNVEQIRKGLECCSKDDCDNCPNSFGNCYSNLAKNALALIEELTAENKLLNVELGNANSEILRLIDREKELTEENVKLAAENVRFMLDNKELLEGCENLKSRIEATLRVKATMHEDTKRLISLCVTKDAIIEDLNKSGAVRHGHWISENRRPKSYQFRCSVCDGVTYYLHRNEKGEKQCLYKYCPHCGAKMEIEGGKG